VSRLLVDCPPSPVLKENLWDKWSNLFTGQVPFLSPNLPRGWLGILVVRAMDSQLGSIEFDVQPPWLVPG